MSDGKLKDTPIDRLRISLLSEELLTAPRGPFEFIPKIWTLDTLVFAPTGG
jgi:hypothetical protein